ncbi:MAG: hypothetical protein ACK2T7_09435 [Anaerolineales bacterium]
MRKSQKIILILAVVLLVMACSTFGFSRDENGKLLVETNLSLDLIRRAIESAVDFTQVSDLQIELQEGYLLVTAATVEVGGATFRDVSFHLELFVVNGRLSARLTRVSVVGEEIDEQFYAPFNQLIAEKLAETQGQMEMMDRAELVEAQVTTEGVTLVWRLNSSK